MHHETMPDNAPRHSRRAMLGGSIGLAATALGGGWLLGPSASAAPEREGIELQVGLAAVSITPQQPVWLYGYAGKARFRPYTARVGRRPRQGNGRPRGRWPIRPC